MFRFKRNELAAFVFFLLVFIALGSMAHWTKTMRLRETHVKEGEHVELTCKYTDFSTKVDNLSWIFQGTFRLLGSAPLMNHIRVKVSLSEEQHSLEIRHATEKDSGAYICSGHRGKSRRAENIHYHLLVEKKGKDCGESLASQKEVYLWPTRGEEVQLFCPFHCPGKTKATWKKDGRVVKEDNNLHILRESDSSVLVIQRFHRHNFGTYSCEHAKHANHSRRFYLRKSKFDFAPGIMSARPRAKTRNASTWTSFPRKPPQGRRRTEEKPLGFQMLWYLVVIVAICVFCCVCSCCAALSY